MKLTSLFLIVALSSSTWACNIPVFRYALERWRPDPCEVILFYDGELSAEHEAILDRLGLTESVGGRLANVNLVRSKLVNMDTRDRELWQAIGTESKAKLPHVVVRSQLSPSRTVTSWHGPLDMFQQAGIFDSPARRELSRRLLDGHSIVWVMIASEDESRNEKTRRMLTGNFEQLEKHIELPEGIGLPGSELHSEIPLFVKFSLLEIARDDPRESFLTDFLSGFQPEAVADGEPLVIPVFGRGRALEVIPATDLSERLMEDLTVFLSGACSCQVKEQNPGFDLLLSVDWNKEIFGEGVAPPPARTTRDRDQPVLLTIPPGRN